MADTFLTAIEPLNFFVSILCGFPSITRNENEEISWRNLVKPVLSITFFIIATFFALQERRSLDYGTFNELSQTAYWIQLYAYIAITLTILIQSCLNYKKIPELLEDLEEIDNKLLKNREILDININYNDLKKTLWKTISAIFLCHVFVEISDFLVYIRQEYKETSLTNLAFVVISYMPLTIICHFTTKVCTIIWIIGKRFMMINHQLNYFCAQEFSLTDKITFVKINYSKQLAVIQLCCQLHVRLCSIIRRMNALFGVQLLLLSAHIFYVAVTHLYFLALMLFILKNPSNHIEIIFMIVWTLYNIGFIIAICQFGQWVAQEAKRTALLMHSIDYKRNPEIKDMIEMWSLRMAHEDYHFSACGFFQIDLTLIYAMIGSWTSYLIILIQFNESISNA